MTRTRRRLQRNQNSKIVDVDVGRQQNMMFTSVIGNIECLEKKKIISTLCLNVYRNNKHWTGKRVVYTQNTVNFSLFHSNAGRVEQPPKIRLELKMIGRCLALRNPIYRLRINGCE